MTQFYDFAGLFIIMVWIMYRILSIFFSGTNSLAAAAGLVLVGGVLFSPASFFLVAVLAPLGAMVPALALQNVMKMQKIYEPEVVPTGELVFWLAIYLTYLSASMGVFNFDPYRYGYVPIFGSAFAFSMSIYAVWRKQYFIAGAIIIGQLAWTFDIGSTNFFDHISHVMLVPILVVILVQKLYRRKSMNIAASV